ncbi:MAG TPA: alpha-L-fucosidase [Burkholderiaceae bacterium]
MKTPISRRRRGRCLISTLALLGLVGDAGAQELSGQPERGSVPPSKLYDYGVMGPPATPEIVAAALAATGPLPPGPVEPAWDSIARHYRTPAWFGAAKFGIFLHWGIYAVPAHHNEWYEKHMYASKLAWHINKFGPPEQFGYKDFIPRFTQEKFKAAAWAALFKQAGARFVMPSAQHHDNFALWDSAVTPFNARRLGPKRDLIGELAVAVRAAGLQFGLSNHGMENFTFIQPEPALKARLKAAKADLYDPAWRDFYNVADRSPAALTRFLADWLRRNEELIDKYQPDLLWFDNGVNLRVLDPLKLRVAAYLYNRAAGWGKEVAISSKYIAYAPSNDDTKQVGSIIDFEKIGLRSPAGIRPAPWMVDDAIGSTWGYTEGMTISDGATIVKRLVDTVSKDGFYLLNLSPKADGTIPEDQQRTLREIGAWLARNGEAIYGSHAWTQHAEGEWRFTVKGDALYAIGHPVAGRVQLAALPLSIGNISRVEQLGYGEAALPYRQDAKGLCVKVAPNDSPMPITLKLSGLKLKQL